MNTCEAADDVKGADDVNEEEKKSAPKKSSMKKQKEESHKEVEEEFDGIIAECKKIDINTKETDEIENESEDDDGYEEEINKDDEAEEEINKDDGAEEEINKDEEVEEEINKDEEAEEEINPAEAEEKENESLEKKPIEPIAGEIWGSIPGFSKYLISNMGRVQNKKRKLLFKLGNHGGYLCTSVINDANRRVRKQVHQLVATCFLPNPEGKETVDHKDRNKSNNKVENLKWANTKEQNVNRTPVKKEIKELLSAKMIYKINITTGEKTEYKSLKHAAQFIFDNKLSDTKATSFEKAANGIRTQISLAAKGKIVSAYGYKWEFHKEDESKYVDEEWRDIPDAILKKMPKPKKETKGGGEQKEKEIKGSYQVSNYGRVRNRKGDFADGSFDKKGYPICRAGNTCVARHRLVAQMFIPNPDGKAQVNHIDGVKTNSHVSNLQWCTNTENQIHKVQAGLSNSTKKIIQYDLNMKKIKEYKSQTDAAKELGITKGRISKCCRGEMSSTNGFIFKFDTRGAKEEKK